MPIQSLQYDHINKTPKIYSYQTATEYLEYIIHIYIYIFIINYDQFIIIEVRYQYF